MQVLLVEDDPVQCSIVSGFLERAGYAVDTAATRDRALELLNKKQYDVAVIDLVLAVSTGDTVAYQASLKGMAVVLISAANNQFMSDMKATLELRGATISSVLTKPFTPHVLIHHVKQAATNKPAPKPEGAVIKPEEPALVADRPDSEPERPADGPGGVGG